RRGAVTSTVGGVSTDDGTGRAHAPRTIMTRGRESRIARVRQLHVISWLRRAEPQPTARPLKVTSPSQASVEFVQVRCQRYFAYGHTRLRRSRASKCVLHATALPQREADGPA